VGDEFFQGAIADTAGGERDEFRERIFGRECAALDGVRQGGGCEDFYDRGDFEEGVLVDLGASGIAGGFRRR
jgi:hypothetical protein